MQTATTPQITKIHVLLNRLGWIGDKKDIIRQATYGRTESTRGLFMNEATALIKTLVEYDPAEKQKSLIFSLAYKAGIIYGDTPADKKMNAAKLTMFLKERGAVKKGLNEMTFSELVQVHRQFEGIVSNTRKSRDKKAADKAVKELMGQFGNIHTI